MFFSPLFILFSNAVYHIACTDYRLRPEHYTKMSYNVWVDVGFDVGYVKRKGKVSVMSLVKVQKFGTGPVHIYPDEPAVMKKDTIVLDAERVLSAHI